MSYRKMTVDGENWEFKIGRSNVHMRAPDGKGHVVNFSQLTGRSWDTLERGQHKRTTDGMVKPGHVRGWIQKIRRHQRLDHFCGDSCVFRPRQKKAN
jgi:hypothetical protein